MSSWSDAVSKAKAALGKEGKLPKPRVDPEVVYTNVGKSWGGFDKSREDLEKKILELENTFSTAKNTFAQYYDLVDGDDFELDEKVADNGKKIKAASDILLKELERLESRCDEELKTLSTLDRLLTDLRRLSDLKK
jgi:hypothetical protein